MDNKIKLSYVITTYNKLPYLKNVLSTLLENVGSDEEVVVTDGASTDGTLEYLKELLKAGKIHQLVSEKDKGEAHGWNKAFLLAKGELIKVITDDDVFDYSEIKKCKDFMLSQPEIDFLGTDGVFIKHHNKGFFNINSDYSKDFLDWKINKKPFAFCGLGWMVRKSSLALIGLLDTSFVSSDAEYTLKVTSGKGNIAWYTGKVWTRISNQNSNSSTQSKKIRVDRDKLRLIYPGTNLSTEKIDKNWHDFLPQNTKTFIKNVRNKILKRNIDETGFIPTESNWNNIFILSEKELKETAEREDDKFLYKDAKQN